MEGVLAVGSQPRLSIDERVQYTISYGSLLYFPELLKSSPCPLAHLHQARPCTVFASLCSKLSTSSQQLLFAALTLRLSVLFTAIVALHTFPQVIAASFSTFVTKFDFFLHPRPAAKRWQWLYTPSAVTGG